MAKPKKQRRPKNAEGRMSLGDHLAELRDRLLIVAISVVVMAVAGWFLYYPVFNLLYQPFLLLQHEGYNVQINIGGVAGSFETHLRLAAYIGVALSIPVIVYEAWAFIALGLHKNERKWALAFLFSSGPLFAFGAVFGYFAITRTIPVLMTFGPNKQVYQLVEFKSYLELVVKTCMIFGIAFIFPVFLVGLNMVGILPWRTMLKSWRWAIFLSFLFTAAMVPTPEPLTLLIATLPFLLLFFGAVGASFVLETRKEKRAAKARRKLAASEAAPLDYTPNPIELPKSIDTPYSNDGASNKS